MQQLGFFFSGGKWELTRHSHNSKHRKPFTEHAPLYLAPCHCAKNPFKERNQPFTAKSPFPGYGLIYLLGMKCCYLTGYSDQDMVDGYHVKG